MKEHTFKNIIYFLSFFIVFFLFSYDRVYIDQSPAEIEKEINLIKENGKELPPREFKTDGCSLWPDSILDYSWQEYCIEHDLSYWAGGTEEERLLADEKLRENINKTIPIMGDIVYLGVRLGGEGFSSLIPWPWGWGYGWNNKDN